MWLDLVQDSALDISWVKLLKILALYTLKGTLDPLEDALLHASCDQLFLVKWHLLIHICAIFFLDETWAEFIAANRFSAGAGDARAASTGHRSCGVESCIAAFFEGHNFKIYS